jgi:isoleucyl-tRNA synthetase
MSPHKMQPVANNPEFVASEEALLKHYYEDGLVEKYLHKNDHSDKRFSFFDGPITANNPMGVHHGWGRTYKDLWQKYHNLKGYAGRFQNGFDCQGLWVEVEVEKELGFKNKRDIESYGVDKFVELCKERVRKYSAIQTEQSKRLGYFMDWDNSYFTMSDDNNYMIWHFLKVCHDNGWIYKGHDSVPWCPRCQTAISQHEMLTEDYKELVHDSVYLELKVVGRDSEFLVIWTTTPWTIPANIAVAVDVKLKYSLVEGREGNKFWVAKDAVERVFADAPYKIIKTVFGQELVGLKYTAPFDHLPAVKEVAQANSETFHSVVATDSQILPITTSEGTGLVHTAVSAGSEDFKLGKLRGLPMIPVIDDEANYLAEGFGDFSGQNAKKHPEIILDFLRAEDEAGRDCLFKIERYKHRYPACWRCKTELVWKVADEWYISMDKAGLDGRTLRSRMQEVAKKINWKPEFGLERELDWLSNMHDWLISKPNRYWGLALPIYECECGHFQLVGGRDELKENAVSGWDEFEGHSPHKPFIDVVKIKCDNCGQPVSRIPDVGNVWLDAGVIPFSTLIDEENGKPSFTGDQTYFKKWFPATFITESFPGQFKNWFYSLIAMSTVLVDEPSFKTVLGYASMLAEDGRAMHKSWGNSIEFNEGAKTIGVDIMRWMFVRHNPTQNLLFGYKNADLVRRQFHLLLWNSYRFFVNSATDAGWQHNDQVSNNVLDRWIKSRLAGMHQVVTKSLDNFDSYHAALAIEEFVSDLSTWYIRRSRDRVSLASHDKEDRQFALNTMHDIFTDLSIILSPFMPFLPDRMYKNLTGELSVHLATWPTLPENSQDQELETSMQQVKDVVEKAHALRKEGGTKLRLRQPLAKLSYSTTKLNQELEQLVQDELNVKSVVHAEGDSVILLDTNLTPELIAEGKARDLMRDIQNKRKSLGLSPTDPIEVTLPDWSEAWTEEIKQKVGAHKLTKGAELVVHVAQ